MSKWNADNVKENDVLVICGEDNKWCGCLLVVDEVKSWGVQGFLPIPNGDGTIGLAYYRVSYDDIRVIGNWPTELERKED